MSTEPTQVTGSPKGAGEQAKARRRVLTAGGVGTFVEFYDFAIYGYCAPVIAAQFFPGTNQVAALLSTFAVYGIAFVIRPLGGVLFGALGDRIGRRGVLSAVLLLIGIATATIGLLPTYHQIGLFAPLLLVLCRLLQGLSAGGEAIGATSFVYEHAPAGRRGMWVTIVIAMSALPSVVAALFVFGLTSGLSEDAFNSWGWRIPFLVALPMSLIGLYIRMRTEESPEFEQVRTEKQITTTPVRDSFRQHLGSMVFVFCFAALSALGFYFLIGYLATYLDVVAGLSREHALLSNSVALLVFTFLLPVCGRISDSVGRKRMLLAGAAMVAICGVPAFLLIGAGGLLPAILGQVLLAAALCVFGGGSYPSFVEMFPTATRFTGAAISYNIGYAALGGTAPFVGTYLVSVSGNDLAPSFYLAVVAAAVFLVALRMRVKPVH
ncbi:MHS family proline/betaine transporter-like MFS transporter [Tamaricihabitans halophyticus]|uniref:Putative proline/betaine transporter n=1 Tax=Tamaricihabitans halophyticus TaxID=1262583 RepID=A0A4R2QYU7_9PSEU|nr:MFS transporter [Tamaricihabitans halophyticus]TCP54238.1 MHS family proline/betaine transporter-like MFS transporter [Tamaricihabitans halophyticus]